MKIFLFAIKVVIFVSLVINMLAFTATSETEYGLWAIMLLMVSLRGWEDKP